MAIFQMEISDPDVQRVFDAVCANYGWKPESDETKGDFTHRIVRQFLSENVNAHEVRTAKELALESLDTVVILSNPEE
jgi:hypothetical protein